tara:strand:+ start:168 stop:686 length:519 start_codon:yes stop_codon:yes gene_type:complete
MKPKFLYNPKTAAYRDLKRLVLSDRFNWCRCSNTVEDVDIDHHDYPFLGHMFLRRPYAPCLYSEACSTHVKLMEQVFREIADVNELNPQVIFRMNANAVYPTGKNLPSPPHVDHIFDHKNMIIYLTNPQGGSTIVEGKEYLAKEDQVLIFDGKHCARPPSKDVRIVLVITFL